jgi:hypothetical protein
MGSEGGVEGHWYKFPLSRRSHYFTPGWNISLCGNWSLVRAEFRQEDLYGALSNCKKCQAAKAAAERKN